MTPRILAKALFAILLAAAPIGYCETPLFHVDDPDRMGRPKRIVPPTFPPEAIERHSSGHVDIEGRITGLWSLDDVRMVSDPPEATWFIKAVEDVLPLWEFYPILDDGCMPSNRRVANRVSFEWVDGQPKIFVTMKAAPENRRNNGRIKALERVEPRYPAASLKSGYQAYVYAELHLLPDGSVKEAKAQVYPDRGARNKPFEREVLRALSLWRFTPGDEDLRVACYDIIFTIR